MIPESKSFHPLEMGLSAREPKMANDTARFVRKGVVCDGLVHDPIGFFTVKHYREKVHQWGGKHPADKRLPRGTHRRHYR